MKPSNFPQANTTVRAPKELAAIREYVEGETYISLWRASFWERIRFLLHGRLWLFVVGQNHPPMTMMIIRNPFIEDEPKGDVPPDHVADVAMDELVRKGQQIRPGV